MLAWPRLPTFNALYTVYRCTFTVPSAMLSCRAIDLFDSPRAASASTSIWRGVSTAPLAADAVVARDAACAAVGETILFANASNAGGRYVAPASTIRRAPSSAPADSDLLTHP